jgi:hypothetical protein
MTDDEGGKDDSGGTPEISAVAGAKVEIADLRARLEAVGLVGIICGELTHCDWNKADCPKLRTCGWN